jgi:hypothetical protein
MQSKVMYIIMYYGRNIAYTNNIGRKGCKTHPVAVAMNINNGNIMYVSKAKPRII